MQCNLLIVWCKVTQVCKMNVCSTSTLSTSIFAILSKNTNGCHDAPDNKQSEIDFCRYLTKHCQPFPRLQSKLFLEDISFNAMRINANCKASENLAADISTNCIRVLFAECAYIFNCHIVWDFVFSFSVKCYFL